MLIQGVIDAYIEEADGFILIDYKTDYVPKEDTQKGEELLKEPLPGPTLWVDPEVKDFYQFTTDSFKLENYQYHPFDHKVPVAI